MSLLVADWPEQREVQARSFWLFFFTSCFIWLNILAPSPSFL